MVWVDTVIQGILLGGLYALFAVGLSIIFGIMRLVNLAHGDFMVLGAFAVLVGIDALGLNIIVSAVLAAVIMFGIGYLLQSMLLNRRSTGYPAAAVGHVRAVHRVAERHVGSLFRRPRRG